MTLDSAWRRAGDCAADAAELEALMVIRARAGKARSHAIERQARHLREEAELIIIGWYLDWERYGAPPP